MKNNGKENHGAETASENIVGSAERAQYEVFRNGSLPRETIDKWVRNDLTAIMSFCHTVMHSPDVWNALVDALYAKYQSLHTKEENNDKS